MLTFKIKTLLSLTLVFIALIATHFYWQLPLWLTVLVNFLLLSAWYLTVINQYAVDPAEQIGKVITAMLMAGFFAFILTGVISKLLVHNKQAEMFMLLTYTALVINYFCYKLSQHHQSINRPYQEVRHTPTAPKQQELSNLKQLAEQAVQNYQWGSLKSWQSSAHFNRDRVTYFNQTSVNHKVAPLVICSLLASLIILAAFNAYTLIGNAQLVLLVPIILTFVQAHFYLTRSEKILVIATNGMSLFTLINAKLELEQGIKFSDFVAVREHNKTSFKQTDFLYSKHIILVRDKKLNLPNINLTFSRWRADDLTITSEFYRKLPDVFRQYKQGDK